MKTTTSNTATILVKKIITLDYLYVNSGAPGYPAWFLEADNALLAVESENYTPAHTVIESAQYALGIC